ncbi:MAG TPA: aliphatic sulfonate ABC transporter substrate-binding protein [Thermoanaerobaculia bacterium]|nr:aliphatic sulfonate ABC transporter substrate-binding protein [Thermoanaerobaculia bacterium]
MRPAEGMSAVRRVSLRFTVLLALSAGLLFAGSPARGQTLLPINIGYQSNTDWLLFVAKGQKLFEKAGLAPTFVKFTAGPPMVEAARQKKIDVTSIGSVPFLLGLAEGVDWVIVGINPEGAYGEGLVARKDGGIATVADLPGKRIGYAKGTTAHFGLIMALKQLGIRRDQVTLLDMAPAEQLTALSNREIDAAMVWEPWMRKMVHEADGRILVTEGDLGTYSTVDVYAARREWLRDNRAAAVRFLRAILMAGEIMQKDPRIGLRALAAEMGIMEGWAEEIYDNSPPPKMSLWTDSRYRYSLVKDSAFHRRLGYLSNFLFDEKISPQRVDVRDVLDASLIAEAVKASETGP